MITLKRRLLRAVGRFHRFLRANFGFVSAIFLLNFSSYAWQLVETDRVDVMISYGFTLFLAVCLITGILNKISKPQLQKTLKILLLAIFLPIEILELFIMHSYRALIGPGVIGAILETNLHEAWEFAKMYGGMGEIITVLLGFGAVYFFYRRRLWKRVPVSGHAAGRLTAGFLLVAAIYSFRMLTDYIEVFYQEFLPLHRFCNATGTAVENMIAYHELKNQLDAKVEITKNNSTIPHIVFILGESTNRNHMGLYGYYLPNTPHLSEMAKKGEIAVYTDVVSPHSMTIAVLCKMMTFCHNESPEPWYKYATLIDVMKAAGYRTYWLSNQESSGIWGNVGQLFAEKSHEHHFTRLRESREDMGILDEELLPLLDKTLAQKPAEKNFYILHLMGGHGLYYNRYPYIFHKFTDADIKLNVSKSNRLTIAEYDNALYYGDHVVNEIIDRFRDKDALVIFLPDHGEAVYDEGIGFAGHIEENANRHMIEVPLVFWASQKFLAHYPEKWAKLKKYVARPYMTDDMIHTVLDLADITTAEFDPARSIINAAFDRNRPRIFDDTDYDRDIKEDHD